MNIKALKGFRKASAETRFDQCYTPEPMSGCWLWLGAEQGSNGYGRFKVNGKGVAAHRFSYERFRGPIPEGLFALHHCDTPACVNPNHLFTGTHLDNTLDKVRKGRQAKGSELANAQGNTLRRGELNGNRRLTNEQVVEIRALNMPQRKIATQFNVSQALISKIKRKEMWT